MTRRPSKKNHHDLIMGRTDPNEVLYPGKTPEAALLRQEIRELFPVAACPSYDQVAPSDSYSYEDTQAVAEDFADAKWNALSPEIIRINATNLPLITKETFAVVLPAYLLYPIEESAYRDSAQVAEQLFFSFCPHNVEWPKDRDSMTNQFDWLSANQKKLVSRWLSFVLSHSSWYDLVEDDFSCTNTWINFYNEG